MLIHQSPLEARLRMLEMDYDPALKLNLVLDLERCAEDILLPRRQLRLLGQDSNVAKGFVDAHARGEEESYLLRVDWGYLEKRLESRHPIFN